MSEVAKHYKVGRIGIGNAAKVGGTLGCVVGFLGGLIHMVVFLKMGVPSGNMGLLIALPIIYLGVVGFDCMLVAALCAWVFNITTRFSGGLVVQLEELPDPVAAA